MSRSSLLILALLLAGCAQAEVRSVSTGERAAAPPGYLEWCRDNPQAAQCGGTK